MFNVNSLSAIGQALASLYPLLQKYDAHSYSRLWCSCASRRDAREEMRRILRLSERTADADAVAAAAGFGGRQITARPDANACRFQPHQLVQSLAALHTTQLPHPLRTRRVSSNDVTWEHSYRKRR